MKKHYTIAVLLLVNLLLVVGSTYAQFNTKIDADDVNIQYMGRFDKTNPKSLTFSYPGTEIRCKFDGTGIEAEITGFTQGTNSTNYYNVFIDDTLRQKLKIETGKTRYTLVSGLPKGVHTLKLTKRTESSVGFNIFGGFHIEEAQLLSPDPLPTKKIEFFGDSWTCGYGNEYSGAGANTGFQSKNEDNYHAWGAIACRRLDAQYHCTAYSGRGLFRNNTLSTNGTLPAFAKNTIPDTESMKWDFTKYVPDVVVIHIGTNDFYGENSWTNTPTPLDSAGYVDAYIGFLDTLRVKYGANTKIICAFGSSLTYNNALKQFERGKSWIQAVKNHFNNKGDNEVYDFYMVPQAAPYGEDWHPAKHEHIKMADQIVPYIQQITNWKDCEGVNGGNAFIDDCKICVGGNTGNTACTQPELIANSILDLGQRNKVDVYPNPASDIINLKMNHPFTWFLRNTNGQTLKTGTESQIDIIDLPAGVYFLHAPSINGIQKIVKK